MNGLLGGLLCTIVLSTSMVAKPFDAAHVVSPTNGSIGDRFVYQLRVTADPEVKFSIPELNQVLSHFHLFDVPPTTTQKNGSITSLYRARFTAFDPGVHKIPTQNLVYQYQNQSHTVVLPALEIQLRSVLTTDAAKATLKPIHPPFQLKIDKKPYLLAGVAIIGLLALLIVGRWLYRKRKKTIPGLSAEPEVQDPRKPWEIAYDALDTLEAKNYLAAGQANLHYFGLTEILKTYFSAIFNTPFSELTSSEIMDNLSQRVDDQTRRRINRVLEQSDIIKFAKVRPDETTHKETMDRTRTIVERIKEIFLDLKKESSDEI